MLIDVNDLYNAHERKQEEWLKSRPVCCKCGDPIQDEFGYFVDNDWICQECMKDFIKWIEEE